jgi:hypothetical protein
MSNHAYGMHPPGRSKKILYAVFGFVIFLSISVLLMDIEYHSPQLCSSCHTMGPEYYTWKASSHNKLGCVDCHRGEGIQGQVEMLGGLAQMAESTVFNTYVTPIRLFRSIDDENCFKCHSFNRQASVSGDLIIPHEDHTASNVRCVSCHSGVAHGDIARRRITQKIGYDQWDKDQGLQEMARELTQPGMDACMSCHYRRKVTTDCSACHTDMYGPESHDLADFGINHGDWAREDLSDCNFCHGYVGPKKMDVLENTDIVEYSRYNSFCLNCHTSLPESHEKDSFFSVHGSRIVSGQKDQEGCLVCHDNNMRDIPQVTNTSCASCHPSSHGKNWRRGHYPAVGAGEKISQECLSCHSTTTCLSCHTVDGYSDWWTPQPQPDTPANDFDPFELGADFFM